MTQQQESSPTAPDPAQAQGFNLPASPSRWRSAQHPLGTPDTRRRGLSTRNARRAFTSKPPFPPEVPPCFALTCSRVMVISLKEPGHRAGKKGGEAAGRT